VNSCVFRKYVVLVLVTVLIILTGLHLNVFFSSILARSEQLSLPSLLDPIARSCQLFLACKRFHSLGFFEI